MAKFQSTDLFFLQRPSDFYDQYKAVTRDSMKYLGILTNFTEPADPSEGTLWWQPVVGQMFVYHSGRWIDTDGSILAGKVSRSGDSMTGDLVMLNDSSVNFPLEGGLTIGSGASKGHMLLLNFNSGSPIGSLTIPSPRGLDTIAQWKDDGLYVLYPPTDPDHATNKKYVDDENEAQNLVINQNSTNIIALLDDLESVRPSIIRQKYDYVIPNNNGDPATDGRIYFSDGTNILNTYTDTVTEIYLNKKANNGITYDFQNVTTDHYVEVQDVLGIGILLCEITNIVDNVNTIKLEVDVVKNRDDGTLVGDPNPTEVRVLIFGKEIVVNVDADGRYAKLYEPNVLTKNNTFTGPRVHVDSNAPLPGVPGAVTSNIFTVSNGATGITPGDERFNINSVGDVTAGTVLNPFLASNDNDVVVKAYLDERMKSVGAYYGDTPPNNPVPGMLWYDTKEDDLTMYMFYENPDLTTVWVPVYSPTKENSGGQGYVKKAGDDMFGDLKFDGTNQVQTRFVNSAQNSGLQLQFNNNTKVWVKTDHVALIDANLKFGTKGTKIISNTDKDIIQLNDNGAFYLGVITVDDHIVNKGYTDTQDNIITQRVAELEEEIRAIAPGIDKGVWEWDANGNYPRDPGAGNFYLTRANFSVTDSYSDADIIVINNNDRGQPSVNHTWGGVLGKLIQLYDVADPDYLLGEITAVDNTTNANYTFLTINRSQSRGGPTEVDINGNNTVRMSIFEAPELDSSDLVTRPEFEDEVYKDPEMLGYRLVSPDDFDANVDGTMTYITDAYLNGAPPFVSPGIKSVKFSGKDISGNNTPFLYSGITFDLISRDETFNGDKLTPFVITNTNQYGLRVRILENYDTMYKEGAIIYLRTPTYKTNVSDVHKLNNRPIPSNEVITLTVGDNIDQTPTNVDTINYFYVAQETTDMIDFSEIYVTDDIYNLLTSDAINLGTSNIIIYMDDSNYNRTTQYIDYVDVNKKCIVMNGDITPFFDTIGNGNSFKLFFTDDERPVYKSELNTVVNDLNNLLDFSQYPELT